MLRLLFRLTSTFSTYNINKCIVNIEQSVCYSQRLVCLQITIFTNNKVNFFISYLFLRIDYGVNL